MDKGLSLFRQPGVFLGDGGVHGILDGIQHLHAALVAVEQGRGEGTRSVEQLLKEKHLALDVRGPGFLGQAADAAAADVALLAQVQHLAQQGHIVQRAVPDPVDAAPAFQQAGAQAADALAEQVGQKGKVGIIAHVAGTTSAIERSEGFSERMKEKYPNIQVLPVQYSDGDPQKAMDKTIDMVQANPDIAGIYATNEGSTLGVANAIDSQNLKGKVKVIGFDSTEAIINFLKNGVIQGFVVQDAYQIGYQGIKALNAVISGQTVAKEIDIPVKYVNAQNINTPEIDKLLHPFGKK